MLKDDDVVLQQQLLLVGHIDKHVGIALIEIVDRYPVHAFERLQQRLVGMRALIGGMGKQYQDLLHGCRWAPQANRHSSLQWQGM